MYHIKKDNPDKKLEHEISKAISEGECSLDDNFDHDVDLDNLYELFEKLLKKKLKWMRHNYKI